MLSGWVPMIGKFPYSADMHDVESRVLLKVLEMVNPSKLGLSHNERAIYERVVGTLKAVRPAHLREVS